MPIVEYHGRRSFHSNADRKIAGQLKRTKNIYIAAEVCMDDNSRIHCINAYILKRPATTLQRVGVRNVKI